MYNPDLKAAAAWVALALADARFLALLLDFIRSVRDAAAAAAEAVATTETKARAAKLRANGAQEKLVQAMKKIVVAFNAQLAEGEARPSHATRSLEAAEKARDGAKAAADAAEAAAAEARRAQEALPDPQQLEDTLNCWINHFAERQQGVAAAAPGDGGGGMNGSQLPALLHWASGCLSALSPRDQWAAAETATAAAGDASSSGRPPQVCVDQLLQAAKRLPGDPDGQPGPLGRVAYAFQREALEFCLGLACWQQAPAARLSGSPA